MRDTYTTIGKATAVYVDGPQSGGSDDNDEFPVWFVWVGDNDQNEIGKVYTCRSWKTAKDLGAKIARDRRLELVDESTWA